MSYGVRQCLAGPGRTRAALWAILVVLCLEVCPAAELGKLRVLYVGNAKSARAAEFQAFLRTNVAQVAVAERVGFDPARADSFDVVLLDWSQSDSRGEFPPRKSPLGEAKSWAKPVVFLGSAGLHMAIVWDVKGGFG
jgi:hypothetical protein